MSSTAQKLPRVLESAAAPCSTNCNVCGSWATRSILNDLFVASLRHAARGRSAPDLVWAGVFTGFSVGPLPMYCRAHDTLCTWFDPRLSGYFADSGWLRRQRWLGFQFVE